MKIHNRHLVYGAAIYQITQHEGFTGNLLPLDERTYQLGDDLILYLTHAGNPDGKGEYQFTFTLQQIDEFENWASALAKLYITLICRHARDVCLLRWEEFKTLWERRQTKRQDYEDQFYLKVSVPLRGRLRVWVNDPGRRNRHLGSPLIVPRTAFPNRLFDPALKCVG